MAFGVYHYISVRYLQRYIDEAVFRRNTREATEGSRFQDMFRNVSKVSTYKNVRRVA